ncbi:MAG TPA: PepSY-associated TM helix domain-containing protein [Polyangiaceae bacterium]|nr:PepSY-associated TM helix domain-containing protein [Polyangiaceae bacterium]
MDTAITPTPGRKSATPEAGRARRRRWSARPWLRALHRDAGYFVVGLTIIYALSGLAVNHIKDWDPSFHQIERSHQLALPLPKSDSAAAEHVLSKLGVRDTPREVYRASDTQLDIVFDQLTFHVDTQSGKVLEEGQEPRFFLRLANWLHLNRGKKAWSYVADGYAVLLLFLAISGLFMIPGKKGLLGRGALVATLGAAVPALYVLLSGGP